MKKQLSIAMIFLSWATWLLAVFFIPAPQIHANDGKQSAVYDLSIAQSMQLNTTAEVPEAFDHKLTWNFITNYGCTWKLANVSEITRSAVSFAKKSAPLFDVKITFIHFFYTW